MYIDDAALICSYHFEINERQISHLCSTLFQPFQRPWISVMWSTSSWRCFDASGGPHSTTSGCASPNWRPTADTANGSKIAMDWSPCTRFNCPRSTTRRTVFFWGPHQKSCAESARHCSRPRPNSWKVESSWSYRLWKTSNHSPFIVPSKNLSS